MFAENAFENLANHIISLKQLIRPTLFCLHKNALSVNADTKNVLRYAVNNLAMEAQENYSVRLYKGGKQVETIFGPKTFSNREEIVSWAMDNITLSNNQFPDFVLAVTSHRDRVWHHIFVLYQ